MAQTIIEAVLAHGQEEPEHLAVAFKKTRLTYRELCDAFRGTARVLHEQYGVNRGDRVMLSAVSMPEYVIAYLAIQYLGAVSVPIDKSVKDGGKDAYEYIEPKRTLFNGRPAPEIADCLSLREVCQAGQEAAEKGDFLPYEALSDGDLAEIILTTGTTGKPKGGMLSIGNIRASSRNTHVGVGMKEDEIVLHPLPLNHSFGMRVLRATLWYGMTLILQNGFTFAKEIENNLAAYHCTAFVSTPAPLEMIYRQMQDRFASIMGQFRYIEVGAGSLSLDMKQKLLDVLPGTRIINTWGSTETGGAIFLRLTEHPDKIEAVGHPVDTVEVAMVDEQGNRMQARNASEAGRLAVRGPMRMMGYFRMPEQTKEALVGDWLYTNDVVYQDEDGFVYMLGRADDIINVGGEKVSPVEVENVAQTSDKIRECACIGVEDPEGLLGQVPALFVVPEEVEFDENDLMKYLSARLDKYKLPHVVRVVQSLPRNRMQKLDRRALRRMWEETPAQDRTNEVVRTILSRRSVRDFTEEEIPRDLLETILQCGYYAPSGHNMQTWRFTVIQDPEKIRKIRDTIEPVAKREKAYFYGFKNPKVLIFVSNDRRNPDGIQDASCAAENIMLAANSYGIGSVWINVLHTICDQPEIRAMLDEYKVPKNHIVWSTIAMGYPKAPGRLLEKKTNVICWADQE